MRKYNPDQELERRAEELIRMALEEDLPGRDITSESVLEPEKTATGLIIANEDLVVSGIGVAGRTFNVVDSTLLWSAEADDGESAAAGQVLAKVGGRALSLMAAERTALNFLQHLCGIATATRLMADLVSDLPVTIMDTRKTMPGWRALEKAAVRHGGGRNHRSSLSEAVLIKDNHLRLAGGVREALSKARSNLPPETEIEVETASIEEVREALDGGADRILVDNADPAMLAQAVALVAGRATIEASGGITVENIRKMAESGATLISVGAITHSARAMDISMEIA